jgi:DGQHR domain-containing protein
MGLVLVTVCTNRKGVPPFERLKAQDLPAGPQSYVSETWRRWLREAKPNAVARSLYSGRGFSEALSAADNYGADLWVVSAGLGLVSGEERVPAYDLTLSFGSESSIRQKVTDEPFDPASWWSDLGRARRPKRSLFNLVTSRPTDQIIISVPGSYLALIEEDLLSIGTSDLSRVRIVGPVDAARVSPRLRPLIMPYDDRFNGQDSPVPGTRADFPQRASRHFLEQIWTANRDADLSQHADLVRAALQPMARPKPIERRQLSDDEIVQVISSRWQSADGQSAKMLRVLRDDEGIACEQGRFAELFKRARRLRLNGIQPDQTLRLRAVRSRQGQGVDVYSFFVPGDKITQLADITRVHRDSEGGLKGFQRDEIKRHVNNIVDYLDQGDVIFPNAIILALSPEVTFTQTRGGKPDQALDVGEAGTLSIPLRPEGGRVAWIVDGQQRSLALAKSQNRALNVPVVAFVAPDLETRREQFILVNKAKPLPTRLINELLPEVETHLPRDLSERKIPSALCELLSKDPASPFQGLIKRLSARDSEGAVVTDSAIIEMIRASLKNPNGALAPFRSLGSGPSDIDGMYATLVLYWAAVKAVFPDAWALPPTKSRLMHSAGIRAMGVLMDRVVTRAMAYGDAAHHTLDSLGRIAPRCRWTAGIWEDLGLAWNDVQQTPRHLRQLGQLLCHLDYDATVRRSAA